MGKKLYLECNTGISGDMSVAALIGLGADTTVLKAVLDSLKEKTGGFDYVISEVEKSGIKAMDFDVILDNDNHDHDMDYLYGHEHGYSNEEIADHHHDHHHDDHDHHHHDDHDHHHHDDHDHHHHDDHDHDDHHHDDHDHDHHHHDHVHRSLSDVIDIINSAEMTDGARELAIKVFTIVAEAESAVHGRTIDEVHFHEVGAIDSIVDIIAAAVCYDSVVKKYNIEKTVITKLIDGTGTIRCQHGILPVPVPAVLKIAEQTGVPIGITDRRGEFVTPTGAAFAAAIMTENRLPEGMKIIKTGIGAGKRNHEIPGILRAMVIEEV